MSPLSAAQKAVSAQAISLPSRVFRGAAEPSALVLHLHGGSFVKDAANCHDAVARLLAEAGAVVVSVDYPTGAAHPFPAALNATFQALKELAAQRVGWAGRGARLFVAGEEAGGNLAAALAMMTRDQGGPALAGQILVSPMLDPCLATASLRDADAGPVGCRWADGWRGYLGSAATGAHPYAAPATAMRLLGLPPALVLTADDDPLRDESLRYAERLRAGGVDVSAHVLPGPTGWPCALETAPAADCPCAAAALPLFAGFLARTALLPAKPAPRGHGAAR